MQLKKPNQTSFSLIISLLLKGNKLDKVYFKHTHLKAFFGSH